MITVIGWFSLLIAELPGCGLLPQWHFRLYSLVSCTLLHILIERHAAATTRLPALFYACSYCRRSIRRQSLPLLDRQVPLASTTSTLANVGYGANARLYGVVSYDSYFTFPLRHEECLPRTPTYQLGSSHGRAGLAGLGRRFGTGGSILAYGMCREIALFVVNDIYWNCRRWSEHFEDVSSLGIGLESVRQRMIGDQERLSFEPPVVFVRHCAIIIWEYCGAVRNGHKAWTAYMGLYDVVETAGVEIFTIHHNDNPKWTVGRRPYGDSPRNKCTIRSILLSSFQMFCRLAACRWLGMGKYRNYGLIDLQIMNWVDVDPKNKGHPAREPFGVFTTV
ncbi:hypothetical protein FISHEDRAFT_56448 [Fistulina hepatica ATCC 64428]|uniref:Uncharacterized protein n=1 Tax=Fistulina hepatica ATCC 64428 TaxID=1128425 RepID=A0A0D7AKE9_9AGAR|nr:hypothetical protein FISHEDRAFT_56448 [Fistulina hepatica ATCC 64428]